MPADVLRIGNDFELDRTAYELRRSGRPIKLERIPMEILLLLIDRRGQLVSREEIIEKIWGKDVFLDTDNSINSAIRKIRQVLKDDPEKPSFIQTVTAKGYRFIAPVTEVGHPAPLPIAHVASTKLEASPPETLPIEPGAVAPPIPNPGPEWASPRRSKWIIPAVALLVVLAAGIAIWRLRPPSRSAATPHRVTLAVLPFANLSNDPEQEYFSEGLTEETITDLGELNPEQLGVIARTSSAAYKHSDKTISQIGHELGVDYIVEGSVRREGGVARVSAQLIRVKDQVNLWTHTYDREAGTLLAMQNELGRAIAQHVQVQLTPLQGGRSANNYAPNPEAYELYLKGRFYLSKRTWPEIPKSSEYFQQAIEKDPGFALAYAGLADSYLANAIGKPQEYYPKAKAAASRASELDDNLAEAHTVLGSVKADFEYDWQGAHQEFTRAIELNPNYADAHYRYAWSYLIPLGKSDQSIAEMKKALELDPFSRTDNTILGCAYFYARRYDEAGNQFAKAIELNPDFFVTYYHRAWLDSQLERFPDAIADLTKGRVAAGDARTRSAASNEVALKKALAADGAGGFWQQLQAQQEKDYPEIGEFAPPQIYARLGDKDKALEALQRDYEERVALGTLANVDPAFDSLRSDPRFQQIVHRMGLMQNSKSQ